jgi:hypothetical protein
MQHSGSARARARVSAGCAARTVPPNEGLGVNAAVQSAQNRHDASRQDW